MCEFQSILKMLTDKWSIEPQVNLNISKVSYYLTKRTMRLKFFLVTDGINLSLYVEWVREKCITQLTFLKANIYIKICSDHKSPVFNLSSHNYNLSMYLSILYPSTHLCIEEITQSSYYGDICDIQNPITDRTCSLKETMFSLQ